jgi:uncharacterized membrane protein YbhN (UPF0104 family)
MVDGADDASARHATLAPPVDLGVPDDEGAPKDRPRGVVRRMLSGVLSYGVVIAIFWFLYNKLSGTDTTTAAFQSITPVQVVVCLVLGLVNLFTNLPPIAITLPGLRLREAGVTNFASAAISNTVPEGGAIATGLNFAMLRSWGFRLDNITSSFLTTGIWTNFVRYGLLAFALVVVCLQGTMSPWVIAAAVILAALVIGAIVLLGVILRSEHVARRLGALGGRIAAPFLRLFRRPAVTDMDERTVAFRIELLHMVQTRWHKLTAAMFVSQLTAILILGVALRMQGVTEADISWAKIVVAWGSMSLASLICPTPGGLGVAELTLVTVLGAGVPDSLDTQITAAVLLFRMATWLEPIPLGAMTYLYWRYNHSWRMTEDERDARTSGRSAEKVVATT